MLRLTLFYRLRIVAPAVLKTKAPALRQISGLNHTAFVLPVYASCQYLYWLRNTRLRWLVRLYRVGLVTYRFLTKGFKERVYPPFTGFAWRNRALDPWLIINILQHFHRRVNWRNFLLSNKNLTSEAEAEAEAEAEGWKRLKVKG